MIFVVCVAVKPPTKHSVSVVWLAGLISNQRATSGSGLKQQLSVCMSETRPEQHVVIYLLSLLLVAISHYSVIDALTLVTSRDTQIGFVYLSRF